MRKSAGPKVDTGETQRGKPKRGCLCRGAKRPRCWMARPAQERNWIIMKIGFWELVVVVIVAFVFIGPDQLPVYAKKLGKMLRELKKYTGAASEEIQKNVVEPLNEIQAPLKEAVAPLTGGRTGRGCPHREGRAGHPARAAAEGPACRSPG